MTIRHTLTDSCVRAGGSEVGATAFLRHSLNNMREEVTSQLIGGASSYYMVDCGPDSGPGIL